MSLRIQQSWFKLKNGRELFYFTNDIMHHASFLIIAGLIFWRKPKVYRTASTYLQFKYVSCIFFKLCKYLYHISRNIVTYSQNFPRLYIAEKVDNFKKCRFSPRFPKPVTLLIFSRFETNPFHWTTYFITENQMLILINSVARCLPIMKEPENICIEWRDI